MVPPPRLITIRHTTNLRILQSLPSNTHRQFHRHLRLLYILLRRFHMFLPYMGNPGIPTQNFITRVGEGKGNTRQILALPTGYSGMGMG